jgi:hypothetical protein
VKTGLYQRLNEGISGAFQDLELNIALNTLDSIVNLIYRAMTGEGRYYHTPEHAIALFKSGDPIHTLAAVFHDIVYYQVDRGFSREVWDTIQPYIDKCTPGSDTICLADGITATDPWFHLVKEIFGIFDGQTLYSTNGSNEFLSSLVMAKKLENLVPTKIILQIACYIEATIPFRPNNASDISSFEILADRLQAVSGKYRIPLSSEEIEKTIQGAVVFANRDVANFNDKDPVSFLENTWQLLPESNLALRKMGQYSLRDYRVALQAMERFLFSINPENVLHEYKGVPQAAEIKEKLPYIRENLTLGHKYLEIKLLTSAILEALAQVSGGDAPVSLFIGGLKANNEPEMPQSGWYFPPVNPMADGVEPGSPLYQLVASGIKNPVDDLDLKTSPLALFIFENSGMQKIEEYLDFAQDMFDGKIGNEDFLNRLDASMLDVIAEAVANQAPARRNMLLRLVSE